MPNDQMSPEVTALAWVPSFARGFVRDLRVRWALEEIGQPYRVRLIGGVPGRPAGPPSPDNYLAEQPFGQVPVYKEGALCLFESGAILLHIGAKYERLLPGAEPVRARAIAWVFAALNTIEPRTQVLAALQLFFQGAWTEDARAAITPPLAQRLAQLSASLGDKDWLDDRFTVGDLLMVDVLRAIPNPALVAGHPNLAAYVGRGTARPAFQRALGAQLADFVPDQSVA